MMWWGQRGDTELREAVQRGWSQMWPNAIQQPYVRCEAGLNLAHGVLCSDLTGNEDGPWPVSRHWMPVIMPPSEESDP